jgi:colanic acid/amylovoran biosynthesis glycosyltransferase
MKPLRIAIFVGTFPAVSETFIQRQIAGLIGLGHEVDIYAETREAPDVPVHAETKKYRLLERTTFIDMVPEVAPWELPVWPITGRTWPPGSATPILNVTRLARALPKIARCLSANPRLTLKCLSEREFGYQAASLSALYRLEKLLSQRKRYDILHAHFGPVGNSFRFARELFKAPLIVSFHGYDYSMSPREHGPDLYRKMFSVADAITVNSQFARRAVEFLGCPPEKIEQLNYGLDLKEFPFRERQHKTGGPVRILSVGRLVEKKGFEHALRAIAKLRERHPDFRYEIIGDGPLKVSLAALARELNTDDLVHFHGAHDTAFIQRAMAESDLFLLPSVTASDGDQEGTPVSILEAQATGLPVVSTFHAGIPEIVGNGESGFLVPEKDPSALAERLAYLVEHPERRRILGKAGRKRMEAACDIQQLNCDLIDLYRKVIQKHQIF